ncbi:unnamed protein product [Fusarium graminearum]|nr:unnamed protein product [Fusarium graminearum]CAG1962013.1 unnamed protein product [Fusarium graminearum]CAG1968610.1 unnamed protein product [Fusarium graminearum]VTO86223.1 unnamed protein product [Fusarium graminearum]
MFLSSKRLQRRVCCMGKVCRASPAVWIAPIWADRAVPCVEMIEAGTELGVGVVVGERGV